MYTAILSILSTLAITGTLAHPTGTTVQAPSTTVALTGVTHTVVAGLAGLHYDPDNVVANVGDIVEYHYLPKNHSVVQSSFDKPCVPINDRAIFSGFVPVADGQSNTVFQITVQDTNPLWIYCAQTVGSHCQNGMASVINQNFNSDKTLANYKKNAALTGTSVAPPIIQGGALIPNPNPLGGF